MNFDILMLLCMCRYYKSNVELREHSANFRLLTAYLFMFWVTFQIHGTFYYYHYYFDLQ